MPKRPTFAALTATALATVLLTGCTSSLATPAANTTANSSPNGGTSSALRAIHDPGHVTGTAPTPGTCHTQPGPRPDPACTPGAYDPAVTQADIATTICRSGYTATVRPPAAETDRLKTQMYRAYSIPAGTASELDHLVPLELGGANDAANLWPEVGSIPNPKDKVETALRRAVCSGKVTLDAARQAIATNWQTAETTLGIVG